MNLLEKSDQEILDIANPLWDNLVNSSNKKDYFEYWYWRGKRGLKIN